MGDNILLWAMLGFLVCVHALVFALGLTWAFA